MATEKQSRWFFGGLASVGAACATHPLDLIKVTLQTQQRHISVVQAVRQIIQKEGFMALYNGLSASILRQLSYSLIRFGAYEVGKQYVHTDTFAGKIGLAGVSGFLGGIAGTPADVINVRMQSDTRLPPEKRRNYKCGLAGMTRVYREEGFTALFRGVKTATFRGGFMTIGQIAFYDQIKMYLLTTSYFIDNLITHFTASLLAGAIATAMTQPLDVIKTRAMNAKPGEFKNKWEIARHTAKLGPLGFFKGFVPTFLRIGPHTILTFILLEQLRLTFGYVKAANPDLSRVNNTMQNCKDFEFKPGFS